MHILSARLFLESAIPRENALCAEIYMRSIILCELEEKPTYVTLPEDADIYLYGFAIDFVGILFCSSIIKIQGLRIRTKRGRKDDIQRARMENSKYQKLAQNSASKKINLQINILFDKIGNLIRKF